MNIRVAPQKLTGTLPAISSKSDAHRILIAAALSDAPTEIFCNVLSEDIRATADCMQALGAKIEYGEGKMTVEPMRQGTSETVALDCGESGSTLRFLLPVVSALGKNGVFTGRGRLPERPVTDLRQVMETHGVHFSPTGEFPIRTSGGLTAGKFTLKGNVSSQYVTGLLFALPLLDGDSIIELLPPVESASYIQMTLSTLRTFGIEVTAEENSYFVKGNQQYRSPKTVTVDGDWSNAAFFLAAGALGGPITVTGLRQASIQGDRAVLDVLRRMGAAISIDGDAVTVSAAALHGVQIDAKNIPDLIPILSVAAANAQSGVTEVIHAGRLRIKESDRLAAIHASLERIGADCTESGDGLTIQSGQEIIGGEVESYNDHRMVMSMAVAATAARGEIVIHGAEAVKKSYPHFFEDFKKLGGKADVLNSDG